MNNSSKAYDFHYHNVVSGRPLGGKGLGGSTPVSTILPYKTRLSQEINQGNWDCLQPEPAISLVSWFKVILNGSMWKIVVKVNRQLYMRRHDAIKNVKSISYWALHNPKCRLSYIIAITVFYPERCIENKYCVYILWSESATVTQADLHIGLTQSSSSICLWSCCSWKLASSVNKKAICAPMS